MTLPALTPTAIDVYHLEAPLARPRRNAFGAMTARPALLVRLRDGDGSEGWGEAFCNWPAFAASYRARILRHVLAPLVLEKTFSEPFALWRDLTHVTRRMAIQANEPGPFEQSIAALDIAAWDLVARRTGKPLHCILGDGTGPVPAYASALTGETIADLVPSLMREGWRGFKLKVGFGAKADDDALSRLRNLAGPTASLMVDANQAWSLPEAIEAGHAMAEYGLAWLEEPLMADAPAGDWRRLAAEQPIPLAAGENIRGESHFSSMISDGGLSVIQPDAIKWGGLSGLQRLGRAIAQKGRSFSPHYLGAGIGLLATAHATIALKAEWLEVDVTENPLRAALHDAAFKIDDGTVRISEAPGLGVTPAHEVLTEFRAFED